MSVVVKRLLNPIQDDGQEWKIAIRPHRFPLTGRSRHSRYSSPARLLGRLCRWCFYGRLFGGPFFPGGLRGAGRLRLCSFGLLLRPPTPYSILNCFSASRTEFSFGLRCYRRGWRCRFRFSPDAGPPPLLRFSHPATSGSREFPALPGGRVRRGGGLSGATGQHGTKFGNLRVDMPLLFLESKDRCGDDFRGELLYWHVSLSHHPR